MIYIARHGETDYNKIGRLQGQRDISLNEVGRCQALELKEKLKGLDFDEIYSSDLGRAYETACIIAGDKKVIQDPRLREICLGSWEGKTYEYLRANDPRYELFFKDPSTITGADHEPYLDVIKRTDEFFASLDTSKNILVITHGFVIYNYFMKLIPDLKPIGNCEILKYDRDKNIILREENK
ncbi:MAG: histidine phosphatase family protein [Ezakiella massiliensis]